MLCKYKFEMLLALTTVQDLAGTPGQIGWLV